MKKTLIISIAFAALLAITVILAMERRGQPSSTDIVKTAANTDTVKEQISNEVTQTVTSNQTSNATEPGIAYPVRQAHTEKAIEADRDSVSNGLDEIKSLLVKMDDRISMLERELEAVRVGQRSQSGQAQAHTSDPAVEQQEQFVENNDDEDRAPSPAQLQKQMERKQYLLSLEQQINTQADQILSDDMSGRYAEIFNGRQEWNGKVAVNSSECGGDYCKIVVSYDNDLDELSKFELDAMLYMPGVEDYPHSQAIYSDKADGTTQVTLYLAAKESGFPAQQ